MPDDRGVYARHRCSSGARPAEQAHRVGERNSHLRVHLLLFLVLVLIAGILGCEGSLRTEPSVPECSTRSGVGPEPPDDTVIAGINVAGEPIKVWDHANKAEPLNLSDAPVSAWREADGTVNLLLPSYEAYRLRGPNLEHLTLDPRKIYSSTAAANQIPEDRYNYRHWIMGPYSVDGRNFYSLAHSEWYASVLHGDRDWLLMAQNGRPAMFNSWVTTVTSFVSTDGGASWRLNSVNGDHVVAKAGYRWTGSEALASKAYMHAANPTGLQQITRMVKEGDHYYALANYYRRDFTSINSSAGLYEAPLDREGLVLLRTADFTKPHGWEAWVGGSRYEPVTMQRFKTFYPHRAGSDIRAWSPTILFDTRAGVFLVVFAGDGSHDAVYYMTTKSLARPSWSDATPIAGTQQLITDPDGGPWIGFTGAHYPSILDTASCGFNFEFSSSGEPWLFFSTAPGLYGQSSLEKKNDVYRVKLHIRYETSPHR